MRRKVLRGLNDDVKPSRSTGAIRHSTKQVYHLQTFSLCSSTPLDASEKEQLIHSGRQRRSRSPFSPSEGRRWRTESLLMRTQDTSSSYLGDQTCVSLYRRIQVSGKRNAPRGQTFEKEPHNFRHGRFVMSNAEGVQPSMCLESCSTKLIKPLQYMPSDDTSSCLLVAFLSTQQCRLPTTLRLSRPPYCGPFDHVFSLVVVVLTHAIS
jgi:hypothetical protein